MEKICQPKVLFLENKNAALTLSADTGGVKGNVLFQRRLANEFFNEIEHCSFS